MVRENNVPSTVGVAPVVRICRKCETASAGGLSRGSIQPINRGRPDAVRNVTTFPSEAENAMDSKVAQAGSPVATAPVKPGCGQRGGEASTPTQQA
jgi:hypothetical protein